MINIVEIKEKRGSHLPYPLDLESNWNEESSWNSNEEHDPEKSTNLLAIILADLNNGSLYEEVENNPIIAYGSPRIMGNSIVCVGDIDLKRKLKSPTILGNLPEEIAQLDYSRKLGNKRAEDYLIYLNNVLGNEEMTGISSIFVELETKNDVSWKPVLKVFKGGHKQRFNDLYLGDQLFLNFLADLTLRLCYASKEGQNPLELKAFVVVDQIDLHLSVRQIDNLSDFLTQTFPNVHFIVTR